MDDKDIIINEEDVENIQTLCILSKGNPGACSVLMKLIQNFDRSVLSNFFNKIISKDILGARLWYLYKNECNHDIHQLIEKDLTPFNNTYFHEKFEKYI